jgi:hypothetical protein
MLTGEKFLDLISQWASKWPPYKADYLLTVKVGLPLSREINNSMKRQGDGRYWAANPYDLLPLCGAVIPLK